MVQSILYLDSSEFHFETFCCTMAMAITKGQIILKCLFGVFNFLQKTNENKSHSSKIEFVCSFFGGNVGLKKSFRLFLTFSKNSKSWSRRSLKKKTLQLQLLQLLLFDLNDFPIILVCILCLNLKDCHLKCEQCFAIIKKTLFLFQNFSRRQRSSAPYHWKCRM